MNISNVQAGTGVYNAVNSNAKPATSAGLDSNVSEGAQKGRDSVSISMEAKKVANKEALAILEEATSLFMAAQKESSFQLQASAKSREELLPENMKLLEKLESIVPSSFSEEIKLNGYISMIYSYGDAEVFMSENDIERKYDVLHQASNLFMNDVMKHPEKYPNIKDVSESRMS